MKKIVILLFICLYVVVTSQFVAQNFNRPAPNDLYNYEYQGMQSGTGNYHLMTLNKLFVGPANPAYKNPKPVIFDPDGYIYWYGKFPVNSALDFKYYPEINKYTCTIIAQGNVKSYVFNSDFDIVDTIITFDQQDVHDIQLSSNGNWLISTAYFDTMDLSSEYFNGVQGSTTTVVKGFGYEEQTQSGNFVQSWNSNDFVSPNETLDFWGYAPNVFDYCHGNAIEEDEDGNLYLSYRHLNAIHKIDRQTGEIIWRLGGALSDFSFTNDTGFSGQHDIRILADGSLSLFDNSNVLENTRGVVYTLDTVQWTANKVFEYIHPVGATSKAMGSYSITADGEMVLGYGLIYRPMPSVTMLDANQTISEEYYFEDSVVTYRALPFDLTALQRPEISCNWNGTNWELSAPNGFSDYQWSNGSSNQSIPITGVGTYQVWVNQGAGMLGSFPFEVIDVANPCALGVEELFVSGTFTYFDLLGHEINDPQFNTVYLKVWESGKVEKIIILE